MFYYSIHYNTAITLSNNPSNEVDSLLEESQQKFIELKFIESSKLLTRLLIAPFWITTLKE